eukprot:768497-Hanusia_phi.AAC.2
MIQSSSPPRSRRRLPAPGTLSGRTGRAELPSSHPRSPPPCPSPPLQCCWRPPALPRTEPETPRSGRSRLVGAAEAGGGQGRRRRARRSGGGQGDVEVFQDVGRRLQPPAPQQRLLALRVPDASVQRAQLLEVDDGVLVPVELQQVHHPVRHLVLRVEQEVLRRLLLAVVGDRLQSG